MTPAERALFDRLATLTPKLGFVGMTVSVENAAACDALMAAGLVRRFYLPNREHALYKLTDAGRERAGIPSLPKRRTRFEREDPL